MTFDTKEARALAERLTDNNAPGSQAEAAAAALTAMVDEVERLEAGIRSRDHALNFILSDAAWTPKHPACESIIKRISSLRKGDGQ